MWEVAGTPMRVVTEGVITGEFPRSDPSMETE